MISLCAPNDKFSCFACCPPIRPAGYDHLDHVGSIRRELCENRRRYLREGPRHSPIIGFTCWALGFLDGKGRQVGCLLHPQRNGGEDLRSLVDYGNKCRRERCVAAEVFGSLPSQACRFWLTLAEGFDSFRFSSFRANPLFRVLHWGPDVLDHLYSGAVERNWRAADLLHNVFFVMDGKWNPRAHRFMFRLALDRMTSSGDPWQTVESRCRTLWHAILSHPVTQAAPAADDGSGFTHLLPLEEDFLDFVRLGLRWEKLTLSRAQEVKQMAVTLAEEIAYG